MVHLPKIDLKELAKEVRQNRKQRLEFVRQYVEWLKKTPNKVWVKGQKKVLGE
ncbi:TPA: hypothetical protein HA316_03000 [Candidatus Micrarchaeota archaeon]|nr:hypothetical protein [Candidatus Micrarchaeota archaeon]